MIFFLFSVEKIWYPIAFKVHLYFRYLESCHWYWIFVFGLKGKGQGQMEVQFVDQFGFHTVTCCGYLPQVGCTSWDWQNFKFILYCLESHTKGQKYYNGNVFISLATEKEETFFSPQRKVVPWMAHTGASDKHIFWCFSFIVQWKLFFP